MVTPIRKGNNIHKFSELGVCKNLHLSFLDIIGLVVSY